MCKTTKNKYNNHGHNHPCRLTTVRRNRPLVPQVQLHASHEDDVIKAGKVRAASLHDGESAPNPGEVQLLPQFSNTIQEPTTASLSSPSLSSSSSSDWCYWSTAYELTQAGMVGSITGLLVALFKLSIEAVRTFCYEQELLSGNLILIALVPALGGVAVGLLHLLGGGTKNTFPPGLRGTVQQVDQRSRLLTTPTFTSTKEMKSGLSSWRCGNLSSSLLQELKMQANFARKTTAAVATLGTGCSLGPEGPCVEIGLNVARACTVFNRPVPSRMAASSNNSRAREAAAPLPLTPSSSTMTDAVVAAAAIPPLVNGGSPYTVSSSPAAYYSTAENAAAVSAQLLQRGWNRVLLSCGAAAGVAAGFNAPLAGVFFALEIMQNTFSALDREEEEETQRRLLLQDNDNYKGEFIIGTTLQQQQQQSFTATTTIAPILIAAVLAALLSQALLGNNLVLRLTQFELDTPLVELPLYLLLGVLSGIVSFCFTYSAKVSQQFFSGEWGTDGIQNMMASIPNPVKPAIGGLFCGLVGIAFPQILFFGYETLNRLLQDGGGLPLDVILSLLVVKTITTAVAAGSGLVGGTFAPSLFLGAMVGGMFHEGVVVTLQNVMEVFPSLATTVSPPILIMLPQIASVPAYAMVGAASVLAALFRAPLTASLLLFEVTRNYSVILPLMASAGIASIVGDILEDRLERRDEMERRDQDPVSWGDLADDTTTTTTKKNNTTDGSSTTTTTTVHQEHHDTVLSSLSSSLSPTTTTSSINGEQ